MLAAEEKYPGVLPADDGLASDVCEGELHGRSLSMVEAHLTEHKYYGIGETGIDLYWDKTFIQ